MLMLIEDYRDWDCRLFSRRLSSATFGRNVGHVFTYIIAADVHGRMGAQRRVTHAFFFGHRTVVSLRRLP